MDMEELRQIIQSFSFNNFQKKGSQGFQRVLIQLFGRLGHGKSSFINTCIYVWTDHDYQNWAKAYGSDGGQTVDRISYQLTDNIFLVDNRGLNKMDGQETGEIFAQLGNLLPLENKVDWAPGFGLAERIVKAEKVVRSSDFIMPVYVHSVRNTITDHEIPEIKYLLQTARDLTGVCPIVVLTYRTSGNLCTVESTFRDMGAERIFAFENYTMEDHFKTRGRHEEVLKFLQEVIKDVQFRVDYHDRNPEKELSNRKQFVLNYIHNREKKRQQDEIEKKKLMEQAKKKEELQQQKEAMERDNRRRQKAYEEEERKRKEELERRRSEELQKLEDQAKQKKKKSYFNIFKK